MIQLSRLAVRFLYILVFCVTAYIIGFVSFIYCSSKAADFPLAGSNSLVVVITGGKDRLKYGLELAETFNSALLLSGANENSTFESILSYNGLSKPNIDKIFIGHAAKNTVENAIETDICASINNFDSVVLVTSNYHLLRSKHIFSHTLSIPVYTAVVKNFEISPSHIFSNKKLFLLALREYNKYLAWLGNLLLKRYFALFNL